MVPRPASDKVYLLTLTVNPEVPEGSYKIVVMGNVSSYVFQRIFYLVVGGS